MTLDLTVRFLKSLFIFEPDNLEKERVRIDTLIDLWSFTSNFFYLLDG